ncbi:unnamed protein product [Calypogeia fissa]
MGREFLVLGVHQVTSPRQSRLRNGVFEEARLLINMASADLQSAPLQRGKKILLCNAILMFCAHYLQWPCTPDCALVVCQGRHILGLVQKLWLELFEAVSK